MACDFTSSYVFMKGSDVFYLVLPFVHLGSRNGGDRRSLPKRISA